VLPGPIEGVGPSPESDKRRWFRRADELRVGGKVTPASTMRVSPRRRRRGALEAAEGHVSHGRIAL
jgi:hypothetical protein